MKEVAFIVDFILCICFCFEQVILCSSRPLISTHLIKLKVYSFSCIFFFFVMLSLQYEKLKFCSNTVDARMWSCLVELITS